MKRKTKRQRQRERNKQRKELRRKCAFWHTKKRMRQRYSVFITEQDYADMIERIQNGLAEFIYAQSLARSVFRIKVKGKYAIVVYNKKHQLIHTAIPEEHLEEDCD